MFVTCTEHKRCVWVGLERRDRTHPVRSDAPGFVCSFFQNLCLVLFGSGLAEFGTVPNMFSVLARHQGREVELGTGALRAHERGRRRLRHREEGLVLGRGGGLPGVPCRGRDPEADADKDRARIGISLYIEIVGEVAVTHEKRC